MSILSVPRHAACHHAPRLRPLGFRVSGVSRRRTDALFGSSSSGGSSLSSSSVNHHHAGFARRPSVKPPQNRRGRNLTRKLLHEKRRQCGFVRFFDGLPVFAAVSSRSSACLESWFIFVGPFRELVSGIGVSSSWVLLGFSARPSISPVRKTSKCHLAHL
jgi:hypothetical protein